MPAVVLQPEPRVCGSQMYLCSWSCSRTGRRSASSHSATSRSEHAVDRREQHCPAALRQSLALDDVARVLVVGAIGDDELDLVALRSRARLDQPVFSASPDPGHLMSITRTTPSGTLAMLRCPPVSSSTVLPRVEQALHQRVHVCLEQRLAAGDLDRSGSRTRRPARRPRRSTSSAPRGTRRACRTSGSADRRQSGGRRRTARPHRWTRPESNGRSR